MSTATIDRNTSEGARSATEGERMRARLLAAMPMKERRLQLAGISTAVLEGGDGPPVVLLHGPGGNGAHFMRMVPQLVSSHRVVIPELPGHGASHVDDAASLTADRVITWLGALIEQTCSGKPALVGQLLGGAIAARFAAAHGDRIRSLALIDAFGLSPFAPTPEFGTALHGFLAQPTEQTHDALWQHCTRDLPRLRAAMGELWKPFAAYNVDRARSGQQALAALMEQLGARALPEAELARIAVPTTLIWGRHDLATPLSIAAAAGARYGWPLHVIEDANDDPPIEQPEAVLSALRETLAVGPAPKVTR